MSNSGRINQGKKFVLFSGFTLIELLVVIAIIALLMAVILPSLKKAKIQGMRVVCSAHQKHAFYAMVAYVQDYQYFYPAGNGDYWLDFTTGKELPPNFDGSIGGVGNVEAYWALAYRPYGAEMKLFKDPAKKWNMWWWKEEQAGNKGRFRESINYSDYGLNGYICWKTPEKAYETVLTPGEGQHRYTDFNRPGTTIVFHDHAEPVMDFNKNEGGDAYFIPPYPSAQGENLHQWRYRERMDKGKYEGSVKECWRHGGSANITWLDGHVSTLKETTGEDVLYSWYTGGLVR